MISPEVIITLDDRKLVASLDALPTRLTTVLRGRITTLIQELLVLVHAAEPKRTGRLVAQTRGYVDEKPDYIRGRVVILSRTGDTVQPHNVAAAALEYGVHRGPRRIPAHRFLRGPAAAVLPRARREIEAAIAEALRN